MTLLLPIALGIWMVQRGEAMLLEEVKLGLVEEQIEQIRGEIRDVLCVSTDSDPYAEGYQDALCWVSDLLDKIELRSTEEVKE